jgi:hypothetical protein
MLSTTKVTHMLQYRIQYHHVGLRRLEVDGEHCTKVTHMLQYRIQYHHVGPRRPEVDVEHHYSHTYAAIQDTISSRGSAETGSGC